jgi:amino acid transporter
LTLPQDLFTAAKVFALVIIIMAGIVWLGFGHVEKLQEPLNNTDWSPGENRGRSSRASY